VSGKLDERIFSKNYSFLDEYRDNEIEVLSKTVKKMKNPAKKEEVKAELLKYVPSCGFLVLSLLQLVTELGASMETEFLDDGSYRLFPSVLWQDEAAVEGAQARSARDGAHGEPARGGAREGQAGQEALLSQELGQEHHRSRGEVGVVLLC
jgi:hypothetical protein